MTVTDKELIFQMATGHEILEHRIPLSEFEPMTEAELKNEFEEGASANEHVVGFKHNSNPAPRFIITRKATWLIPRVIVRMGEMPDYLGPTFLFTPAQRKLGIAKLAFALMEIQNRSVHRDPHQVLIPRLKYNGTIDKANRVR